MRGRQKKWSYGGGFLSFPCILGGGGGVATACWSRLFHVWWTGTASGNDLDTLTDWFVGRSFRAVTWRGGSGSAVS
jgi:hypothetical protein